MSELSNAVKVLIARMESHPEDFEVYSGGKHPKFAGTAEALYGLAGLDAEKSKAYWFLPDADKEALITAWKRFHCAAMEKEVMEKIFDDGQAEREAELEEMKRKHQMHVMKQQLYQQAAQMPQPVTAMNAAQNAAGNTGLFGMAGNGGFLSGVFK